MYYQLNSLIISNQSNISRIHPWNSYNSVSIETKIQGYDYKTLVYDAFFSAIEKRIILICPKLLNFEEIVKHGKFSSDLGIHQIKSIKTRDQYSEIRLNPKLSNTPQWLLFKYNDIELKCHISYQDIETFQNLNCLIALSKDNRLEWIFDWAKHHVKKQGVQAILLIDNNSTVYNTDQIHETLKSVPGLQQHGIIEAPFSWGPTNVKDRKHAWFLQTAMLNLARLRFFSKAAGVLSVDIDELVFTKKNKTIFDFANQSILGFCISRQYWIYPKLAINSSNPPFHADHVYYENSPKVNAHQSKKQTKFCVNPAKQIGMKWWKVHGSPLPLNRLAVTPKVWHYHCFGISTNWNNKKDLKKMNSKKLSYDPAIENDFSHLLR